MGHHDKEYVYLFMCYRDRNVSFTFCGTLLALEYNGMTLYDIILSPQSSVLNRIGNFFHKTAERKNNIFHRFYFCLLYTSPSPRDRSQSRMPSSA